MHRRAPGWHLEERPCVDSTQDVVRSLLREGFPPPIAVRADRQRSGRGRRGNRWESPEGGLWVSLGVAATTPADPFLGLLLGLAALEATEELLLDHHAPREPAPKLSPKLGLKWPNDLLVRAKKWGGVITEVEQSPRGGFWLIFGVGLDLNLDPAILSPHRFPSLAPTSIQREFGQSPSPTELLPRILCTFDRRLAEDRAPGGRASSLHRLRKRMVTIGQSVRWCQCGLDLEESDAQMLTDSPRWRVGRAIDLAEDGGLVIDECAAGQSPEQLFDHPAPIRRTLRAGEIEHLRDHGGDPL